MALANRYNNPGNLMSSPWTKGQPGYVETGSGGLAIFSDWGSGVSAQQKLLDSYMNRGYDTPASIVKRWAPGNAPGNTPASETNYAAYIANSLGIGVGDKIGKEDIGALAQAMYKFEAGPSQGTRGGFQIDQGMARAVGQQAVASGLDYFTGGWFSMLGGRKAMNTGIDAAGSAMDTASAAGSAVSSFQEIVENWHRITLFLVGAGIMGLGILALILNSGTAMAESVMSSDTGKSVAKIAKLAALL